MLLASVVCILQRDGVIKAIFNGRDVLLVVVLDATTKKITNIQIFFNKST